MGVVSAMVGGTAIVTNLSINIRIEWQNTSETTSEKEKGRA
jgi:hypothetical protein